MQSPSPHAHQSDNAVTRSAWYLAAMERLVTVVQDLSQAHDHAAIAAIVRDAARELTRADGATFVLRDGEQCHYVDENAISPLWKGRRFPMSACISGWVMLNAQPTVVEDIYGDPRIPVDAYRPTFVKSLAMVPIRRKAPIGAIGNYWATRHRPTEEEVAILQALADTTSVALRNADLYAELQGQVHTLEEQRTHIREQRDALEVFTRALAHDLTEPVRAIRSYSEIIRQADLSPEKSEQYFRFIQRAADRMAMLVDTVFLYTQLDDAARMAKQRFSMTQALKAALDDLVPLIRERKAVVTADPLPDVHADPDQMILLMKNLLSNAVRHGDGPVSVHVRPDETTDEWLFSVRDDGPGIEPDQLEKIFLPFKRLRANEECAGLGLAICRKVVASHSGRIWCESIPGDGANFRFSLPKAAPRLAETAEAPVIVLPGPTAGTADKAPSLATVLLVDDSEDHLELTRLMVFDASGVKCNVLTARDGSEGLDIIRNALRANERVDLILLDINMPGMDGFEFLERLRGDDALKDIAVVMCTVSNYEKDRERAQGLGAVGYLVKPPSWDRLKAILSGIKELRLQEDSNSLRLLRTSGADIFRAGAAAISAG